MVSNATITARCDWLERELERLKGLSYFHNPIQMRANLADIRAGVLRLEDASFGDHGENVLTMLGIRSTCTAGAPGIYRNWIRKARATVRFADGGEVRIERETLGELRDAVHTTLAELDPDGFATIRITKESGRRVAYVTPAKTDV